MTTQWSSRWPLAACRRSNKGRPSFGAAALHIGVSLLAASGDGEAGIGSPKNVSLTGAVRTILMADFVMSLDNVLAVAAAA